MSSDSDWRSAKQRKVYLSRANVSSKKMKNVAPKTALLKLSVRARKVRLKMPESCSRKRRKNLRQSSERTTFERFKSSRLRLKTERSFFQTTSTSFAASNVSLRKSVNLLMLTDSSSKRI